MSSYNTDSDDVSSVSSDRRGREMEHELGFERHRNAFEKLVRDIRSVLGSSSGIGSDDVDVNDLLDLMREYASRESHWHQYALGDPSRNYTRNLVDEGNGKANLLILVWTPGKGSLIHDHANAHCIMKILKGTLVETLYEWPNREVGNLTAPLKVAKTTQLGEDDVTYISDKIGLHRMSNPSPTESAVSLHLYTPPYAAKYGCRKFDESTGKATHISLSEYFSKFGKRECAGRVSIGNSC